MSKIVTYRASYKNLPLSVLEKDYQDIYDNIYNIEDIIKIFGTLGISIKNKSADNPAEIWENLLCGPKCGKINNNIKIECFGCMLLSRFSPKGSIYPQTFKVEITDGFKEYYLEKIYIADIHGYEEYSGDTEILNSFDDQFNNYHKNFITKNPQENKLAISYLLSEGDDSDVLFSFSCKNYIISIRRRYNYGVGLDGLINNDFTSYCEEGKRYLKAEVVEGIILQLHYKLSLLGAYQYTHGSQDINSLSFSDEIGKAYDNSYNFKLHIIPSESDSVVISGNQLYYKPDNYLDILQNLKSKEDHREIARFHRRHSGWNIDPGKADFYGFIKRLRNNEVFSRSLENTKEIAGLLESEDSWGKLQKDL